MELRLRAFFIWPSRMMTGFSYISAMPLAWLKTLPSFMLPMKSLASFRSTPTLSLTT